MLHFDLVYQQKRHCFGQGALSDVPREIDDISATWVTFLYFAFPCELLDIWPEHKGNTDEFPA